MRIKKRLLAAHIKKGYSIEEVPGSIWLLKDGKRIRHFEIFDTPWMIRRACEKHMKGEEL